MQILLVNREPSMIRAWRTACEDCEGVEGDYFSRPAEAMVSPASSFGIMDGGLDAAIQDVLGFAIQQRVQRVIVDRHHGELPVGAAGSAELRQLRPG
jgi:O-acetyl-ADP-ribose deacetylase (regulator of RNase III)